MSEAFTKKEIERMEEVVPLLIDSFSHQLKTLFQLCVAEKDFTNEKYFLFVRNFIINFGGNQLLMFWDKQGSIESLESLFENFKKHMNAWLIDVYEEAKHKKEMH